MTDSNDVPASPVRDAADATAARKPLPPAAQRALAEAEEALRQSQKMAQAEAEARPVELQGPRGPEPTRYGDWERKGIASDF